MKILITGGTGFVGSNLINGLLTTSGKQTNEIVAIGSDTEAKVDARVKVLKNHMNGIDWPSLENIDAVFHQAANNDTQSQDYREMFKANVWSPMELFERMYKKGCKNFVFASSTAVYGSGCTPYEESNSKLDPLTIYGKSKLEFEKVIFQWAANNDANVVGLRYCNIYGPGESHKGKRASMIHQLIKQMEKGSSPKIFEDGEQKRDWIYVADVVQANIMALNHALKGNSGIFNVGTGVSTSFNDIVKLISDALVEKRWLDGEAEAVENFKPEYIECPFMDSFQKHTECCIKKAETQLGFRFHWNIKNGINYLVNGTW